MKRANSFAGLVRAATADNSRDHGVTNQNVAVVVAVHGVAQAITNDQEVALNGLQ